MNEAVALSVLIPNYNYGRYIGETIESVLHQAPPNIEIVVTDNASTDDSVAVVQSFADARIRLTVNPCNVGFSANLERVASLARGQRMLLLSSDDKMKPDAIAAYQRMAVALGPRAETAVWGAASTIIDSTGHTTGTISPDPKLWRDARPDHELSTAVGFPVRVISATALLRRSLELLRSPLPFATTCYPRALHDAVGGYAGGKLMNPDKWFMWKLLSVAETAYVIDCPLFEYRVHGAGQLSQEKRSGALKHLTDQYVSTFSIPEEMLSKAGLGRDALARAFVDEDIALRGFLALSEGKRETARRGIHFAQATYPDQARSNPKLWVLRAMLALGPLGTKLARLVRTPAEQRWVKLESRRR